MFWPTTECVDSLTIDDVTGQAVPEPGTGRTEWSRLRNRKDIWYIESTAMANLKSLFGVTPEKMV